MKENSWKFARSPGQFFTPAWRTFDDIPAGHECFDYFIFGTKPLIRLSSQKHWRATFRISSYYFLIARHRLPNTHARITTLVFRVRRSRAFLLLGLCYLEMETLPWDWKSGRKFHSKSSFARWIANTSCLWKSSSKNTIIGNIIARQFQQSKTEMPVEKRKN